MQTKSKQRRIPTLPPLLPDGRSAGRATSYDVARLAGVSQSAVSRAFRDGASISRETRAKVESAARELGYAPSKIARSLITQRSGMVGVVVTDLTARNYPDVLFHLGREIQATGNRMLLFAVPSDEETAGASDLLAYHVDGIISSASLPDEMMATCEARGVPIVLYNRVARAGAASAVGCDHHAAMEVLVDHLAQGGLERIAFVAGPQEAPVSRDRLAGLRNAVEAKAFALGRVVHGDYSYESGRALAAGLVSGRDRPDTVACANDAMALGIMDGLRFDLGLKVPEDVAVTGFDDLPQSAWPTYDLTTLRQPVRRMTRAAAQMLVEQAAGDGAENERRLLPAELKIRRSTRIPA